MNNELYYANFVLNCYKNCFCFRETINKKIMPKRTNWNLQEQYILAHWSMLWSMYIFWFKHMFCDSIFMSPASSGTKQQNEIEILRDCLSLPIGQCSDHGSSIFSVVQAQFFNYFLGKPCINVHFNLFFYFCLHIKQYLFPAWNVSWILIKKLLTIICLSSELLKCKDNWVLNN